MAKLLRISLRLLTGGLFLTAGLSKLLFPYDFLSGVYAYELFSPAQGVRIAIVLPWIEAMVGICLIFGVLEHGALCVALVMGTLFAFVRTYALARELPVSCHCFSHETSSAGITYAHLVQSAVIIAGATSALILLLREARRTCRDE